MKRFIVLFLGLVVLNISTYAWEPKPWLKYLVNLEVEKDTVSQPSIMLRGIKQDSKVNTKAYQCGTYYFYQPGIFEEEDNRRDTERAARGDYSTGDFIWDTIFDAIGLFVK